MGANQGEVATAAAPVWRAASYRKEEVDQKVLSELPFAIQQEVRAAMRRADGGTSVGTPSASAGRTASGNKRHRRDNGAGGSKDEKNSKSICSFFRRQGSDASDK